MEYPVSFEEFLEAFFAIFAQKTFRRADYLTYLNQPEKQRGNDEAPIVDTAIVGPLLGLLGFTPPERVYNQQRPNGRPDFAPADTVYGTCFMVEDKNTSLELTLDLTNPESHLSQLAGYVRSAALRLGWLTNGRRLMVWNFINSVTPECVIDLDIPAAIHDWQNHNAQQLSSPIEKQLHHLFDLCRKDSFADTQRLERELGINLEEWQLQALPLGVGSGNEVVLRDELQLLVGELQRDARRILDHHLTRYAEYAERIYRLTDDAPEPATQKLKEQRDRLMTVLIESCQKIWGLETVDIEAIENILVRLEQDSKAFFGPKEVLAAMLQIINEARRSKYAANSQAARPMSNLDDVAPLSNGLQTYCETVFDWHRRQATLRHEYQADRNVFEDYTLWYLLSRETMLAGLNEEQWQDKFALQAASTVLIQLLLIRVCEDKGILPQPLISGSGLKNWQENIKRYWITAKGNPYNPLLDMVYANVQNIYADFFTGPKLFNWYRPDQRHSEIVLDLLDSFDFAGILGLNTVMALLDGKQEKV